MVLLLHIAIAVSSLIYTSWLNFRPSQRGINITSWLIALTLISGTYLVISTASNMLQACMTGLVYLGFVTAGLTAARHRLAKQNAEA